MKSSCTSPSPRPSHLRPRRRGRGTLIDSTNLYIVSIEKERFYGRWRFYWTISATQNLDELVSWGHTPTEASAQEQVAAKAEHISATSAQQSRLEAAKNNPDLHVANNQGKPKADAIKAFDRNAGGAQADAGKEKGKASEGAGNSAFGQKQGDVATRTTGSQNNAYGKAKSTEAHTKSHHASQHPQVTSHRSKQAMVRQGGSATGTHGQAQGGNSNKKKKKSENQGPGGGH